MKFLEKKEFLKKLKEFDPKGNKIFFVFEEGVYEEKDFDEELHVGFDLRIKDKATVKPNETTLAKCGVKWAAPINVFLQINPRSGLSLKTPIRLANTPGTVEASYRNEIGLLLTTYSLKFTKEVEGIKVENGRITIEKGLRMAQAIIVPIIKHHLEVPKKFEVYYTIDNEIFNQWKELVPSKRKGGFGSTGAK
jgi:dUTP pyrophosphatase